MENSDKTETSSAKTISAELSPEQYAFLTNWQKTHEQELGIEIPIGAMVRKAVDIAMKSQLEKKEERPERSPSPSFNRDERGGRPSFGSGPRKSFGDRPCAGRGGPKFDMLGAKNRTRTFNK